MWVFFVVNFSVIGEANQVISLVESLKLIFFQICSSEDFRVSLLVVEDLFESLLVNIEVSFAIDLICVLREDFSNFFLLTKKISKIPEKAYWLVV